MEGRMWMRVSWISLMIRWFLARYSSHKNCDNLMRSSRPTTSLPCMLPTYLNSGSTGEGVEKQRGHEVKKKATQSCQVPYLKQMTWGNTCRTPQLQKFLDKDVLTDASSGNCADWIIWMSLSAIVMCICHQSISLALCAGFLPPEDPFINHCWGKQKPPSTAAKGQTYDLTLDTNLH